MSLSMRETQTVTDQWFTRGRRPLTDDGMIARDEIVRAQPPIPLVKAGQGRSDLEIIKTVLFLEWVIIVFLTVLLGCAVVGLSRAHADDASPEVQR